MRCSIMQQAIWRNSEANPNERGIKALRGRITLGPAKPSAQDRKPTRGVHIRRMAFAPKDAPQPPPNP
ncbi:hypothetical protein GCM10010924_28210 [Rhizobium wenxiniae]|nr:hypothetical protein GCM10010924_28210 [Rhizobium wenxiniae]